MPARAVGDCPECDGQLGVQVDDSVAAMAGSAIEMLMEKEGNAIYCQSCDDWVEPLEINLYRG